MDGLRICYDENGEPITGKILMYHENGEVERAGQSINGKVDGELKVYDEKGNLLILSNFKDGLPEGQTYYYTESKITSIEIYKDGKFVRTIKNKK